MSYRLASHPRTHNCAVRVKGNSIAAKNIAREWAIRERVAVVVWDVGGAKFGLKPNIIGKYTATGAWYVLDGERFRHVHNAH